jgi:OOP family OmpA-OmpF porin
MKLVRLSVFAAMLVASTYSASSFAAAPEGVLTDTRGNAVLNGFGDCWKLGSAAPGTSCTLPAAAPAKEPAVVEHVRVPVVIPVEQTSHTVVLQAVNLFDFARATLKPTAIKALDDLLARKATISHVKIVGHTDSIGSTKYNQKLGQKRADAVAAYLVNKGVNAAAIESTSAGESQPVVDNKTAAHRAQNRRVEVTVTGSEF